MQRIAALLLVLAPTTALANVGVGYFMVAVPVVAIALIPAILLEVPVLRHFLKVSWPRALHLSFIANLFSALFGLVIGLAFDFLVASLTGSAGLPPTRASAAFALVPWFFLSWWIEHSTIAKRNVEMPRPAVRSATGVANGLTYALMFVAALTAPVFSSYDRLDARNAVVEAVFVGSGLRNGVTEFWQAHKRFPADHREIGQDLPARRHFSAVLEKDGRVVVRMQGTGNPVIEGRRVELVPRVEQRAGTLHWSCSSPDLDAKYLPSHCRQQ